MKEENMFQIFLNTYGWAILVVLIGVGTLYYFGIIDFSKYTHKTDWNDCQYNCMVSINESVYNGTQEIPKMLFSQNNCRVDCRRVCPNGY